MMWLKLGGVLAILLALYGAYFTVERSGYERAKAEYEKANNEAIIAAQEESMARSAAYAEKLTEEMKNREQADIARAAAVARLGRMQNEYKLLASSLPRTAPDTADQCSAERTFSVFLGEVLDRAKQRGTELLAECDRLNDEAITVNRLTAKYN